MATKKVKKINILTTNTHWFTGWKYCVSTSTSLMSTSWIEHFFVTKEAAHSFAAEAERQGYVYLIATPETY